MKQAWFYPCQKCSLFFITWTWVSCIRFVAGIDNSGVFFVFYCLPVQERCSGYWSVCFIFLFWFRGGRADDKWWFMRYSLPWDAIFSTVSGFIIRVAITSVILFNWVIFCCCRRWLLFVRTDVKRGVPPYMLKSGRVTCCIMYSMADITMSQIILM